MYPFFGWIVALLWLLSGCATAPVTTLGDDEMVGRPAAAPQTSDAPPPRPGAMWYHLHADGDRLNVNIRLLDPPSTSTFFLPGPWADRDDFDERITVDAAHGPDTHTPLPMTVGDDGRIDVESDGLEFVELTYHVDLVDGPDPDRRFLSWGDHNQFFAYAPAILVLPSAGIAEQIRDIPIEVHTPTDWTVAATWPLAHDEPAQHPDRRVSGFVADDIHSLRDAYIGAGDHWNQHTHRSDHGTLRFTTTADFQFDDKRMLQAIARICDHYLQRFGAYDEISAIALPNDAVDDSSLDGTGRKGGFVIEVPIDQPLDDELLVLSAHEAFHMWNGHRLVPAPAAREDTLWFKEGLTHYVALKTLGRLDLIDTSTIRDELARAAWYYAENPIIAGGQIRAIDKTRLPYDRGLLIALALDMALLEHTGGEKTVEHWIASMLSDAFADEAAAYDPLFLEETFRAFTRDWGTAPARRYDELVNRNKTIDAELLFEQLGLHLIDADGDEAPRLLPIEDRTRPFESLFHPPPDHDLE